MSKKIAPICICWLLLSSIAVFGIFQSVNANGIADGPTRSDNTYADDSEDEIVVNDDEWDWVGEPVGEEAHNYTESPPGAMDYTIDEMESKLDIIQMKIKNYASSWNIELTVKGSEYLHHNDVPTYLYVEYPDAAVMIMNRKDCSYYCHVLINRTVEWKGDWLREKKELPANIPSGSSLTIRVPKDLAAGTPVFFSGLIYNGEFGWFYVDHFEAPLDNYTGEDCTDIDIITNIEVSEGEIQIVEYTEYGRPPVVVSVSGNGIFELGIIEDDDGNICDNPPLICTSSYVSLQFDGIINWTNLTIYLSEGPYDEPLDFSTAIIFYFNGIEWRKAENSGVNPEKMVVWANVTHFTVFTAFALPERDDETGEDDDNDDNDVDVGQAIKISNIWTDPYDIDKDTDVNIFALITSDQEIVSVRMNYWLEEGAPTLIGMTRTGSQYYADLGKFNDGTVLFYNITVLDARGNYVSSEEKSITIGEKGGLTDTHDADDNSVVTKTWIWVAIGAGAIILLAIIIIIIRRRNDDEWDDEDEEEDYEDENKRVMVPKTLQKHCVKCNAVIIDSNAVFCTACGAKQTAVSPPTPSPQVVNCPKCGGANYHGTKFCSLCGTNLLVSYVPTPSVRMNKCFNCGSPIAPPLVFCDRCVIKQTGGGLPPPPSIPPGYGGLQ